MGFGDQFLKFMAGVRDAAVEAWNAAPAPQKAEASEQHQNRELVKEDFEVAGVRYYLNSLKLLATTNPDWKKSYKTLVSEGKSGKRIFKSTYITKPVKLIPEPTNKHDKNAIIVQIAGEKVGYISAEENVHVGEILYHHEVKFISAYIRGGAYKVVNETGIVDRGEREIHISIRIAYV